MPTDKVDDMEIEAYIDGELDLSRRLAVEDHLSRHPDLAAKVMADFRNRSALQLLTRADVILSRSLSGTVEKIRKEGRMFWYRRPALGLAAMAIVALTGVVVLERNNRPPSYINLAVTSHRTLADRIGFGVNKPVSERTHTLLLASRIAVPRLPSDWRVTDVELLDARTEPAILIAVKTAEGHHLSILAIRKRSSAPRDPDTVRNGGQSVAYWRKGDFSYALTGEGDPDQIDATADALADSWKT